MTRSLWKSFRIGDTVCRHDDPCHFGEVIPHSNWSPNVLVRWRSGIIEEFNRQSGELRNA